MFTDIEKYFSSPIDWSVTTKGEMEVLIKKWGQQKVLRLLAANDIELLDDDDLAIDSDEM